MNTRTIISALQRVECFVGVFPRDRLPTKVEKKPAGLIINTDSSDKPGEHWVAIYLLKDGTGDYFDSFGLPPLNKEIVSFLNKNCPRGWNYNKTTLQGVSSTTCGFFCIHFIQSRCNHESMQMFLNKFSLKPNVNDILVRYLTFIKPNK